MNGLGVLLGVLAVPLGLAMLMGDSKKKLVSGHRYRFTAEVKPPLDTPGVNGLSSALKGIGAEILTIHNSENATVVNYELTALENKEVKLNEPIFQVGDQKAVITNVQEV